MYGDAPDTIGFPALEALLAKPEPHWSECFKLDLYDWREPLFARENRGLYAYRVIGLTQGYFTIVSASEYGRVTQFPDGRPKRWRVNIQRDPRSGDILAVYARRNGRKGEPKDVYLHRELTGAASGADFVDHLNGWGLDNRWTPRHGLNLRPDVSCAENSSNQHEGRRTKNDLPIGVEYRHGTYRGVIYRTVDGKRKSFRSEEKWPSPEPAAEWYRMRLTSLHARSEWSHDPGSVHWPVFPPLLESDVSEESWRLRARARHVDADIPF